MEQSVPVVAPRSVSTVAAEPAVAGISQGALGEGAPAYQVATSGAELGELLLDQEATHILVDRASISDFTHCMMMCV